MSLHDETMKISALYPAQSKDRTTKAMWISSIDEGEAQLWYPERLSDAGMRDLIEWLTFVRDVLEKRQTERSVPAPAPRAQP